LEKGSSSPKKDSSRGSRLREEKETSTHAKRTLYRVLRGSERAISLTRERESAVGKMGKGKKRAFSPIRETFSGEEISSLKKGAGCRVSQWET